MSTPAPVVNTYLGRTPEEWTALGTVVSAVGIVLAAAIAGLALWYAARTFRNDRARLEQDAERLAKLEEREQQRDIADQKAQAVRVYVVGGQWSNSENPGFYATVHNASDRPIYNVVVGIRTYTWPRDLGASLDSVTGGTIANAVPTQMTIGPGDSLQVHAKYEDRLPQHYETFAVFTDTANISWGVTNFGHLSMVRNC